MREGRPYLVFASVGERSKHRTHWLRGAENRSFDLILCDYGREPGRYARDADACFERRGSKLGNAAACSDARWSEYRYLLLLDDDLEIDSAGLDKFFAACERERVQLAQPAFTRDSIVSYAFTIEVPGSTTRIVPFVEVGAVAFSQDAYRRCRDTFERTVSGFGQDLVWAKRIEDASAIRVVDEAPCRHPARAADVRSGIDSLLARDEHYREARALLAEHGIDWAQVARTHGLASSDSTSRWRALVERARSIIGPARGR